MRARLPIPALLLLLLSLGSAACDEEKHGTGGGAVGSSPRSDVKNWTQKKRGTSTTDEKSGTKETSSEEESAESDVAAVPDRTYEERATSWDVGKVHDVGPAAPTTATPRGVLFVSKENRLYLAEHKGGGTFMELEAPAELFARYGRGPAVSTEYAYWISPSARLMRGNLQTGEPESLVERARPGARVSLREVDGRDVVGFIRQPDDTTAAFLWAEGTSGKDSSELVQLSPEGSTATSVELVPGPSHLRAVILEGRTSMSPIHVRTVRVTKRRVTLENDQVVWVGPGSHSLTELETIDRPGGKAVAFLATAKGITSFGLAQLWLEEDPGEIAEPDWRIYPNGLDPAPVTATHACGGDWALFAVPSEKKPRSPQELRIARLEEGVLGPEEILARSRAFNDVSVAPLDRGAILSWTADNRTWAVRLGCPKK